MGTARFQFNIPSQDAAQTTPAWDASPAPNMCFTFPSPPPSMDSNKRSRVAADIDGEHSCVQKKKRRLRLFLITSPLSPEFSYPATNIVDRGSSKIAVWAKQRAQGRALLRKAAILNGIRRQSCSATEVKEEHGHVLAEQEEMRLAKRELDQSSVDTYTRPVLQQIPAVPAFAAATNTTTGDELPALGSSSPSPSSSTSTSRSPSPPSPLPPLPVKGETVPLFRSPNEAYAYSSPHAQEPRRDYLPLPPSPLGISNYDALDVDDDIPDPYSHIDEEDDLIFNPYHDNDVNASQFAHCITTNPSSVVPTCTPLIPNMPPQSLFPGFSVPNPEQAVFGHYNQVDSSANAIWPGTYAHDLATCAAASPSPDFAALFAAVSPKSQRSDSLVEPSSFQPVISNPSVSPNFSPCAALPAAAAHFAFSACPSFAVEPAYAPPPAATATMLHNSQPVFKSPNLVAADALPMANKPFYPRPMEHMDSARSMYYARRRSEMLQEQQRQQSLIFMRFGY